MIENDNNKKDSDFSLPLVAHDDLSTASVKPDTESHDDSVDNSNEIMNSDGNPQQSYPTVQQSDRADIAKQIDTINTIIQTTSETLTALQNGFESKIKYDASKERIIDSLHKELQSYRDGLHLKILRPIFFDLMGMHDDVTNLLKHNQPLDNESDTTTRLRKNLVSFQETIESVLEKHGVIAYNEPGEKFFPQRQRALRVELTNDPNKDQIICERIRKGFEYDSKILQPETVVLYKYTNANKSS